MALFNSNGSSIDAAEGGDVQIGAVYNTLTPMLKASSQRFKTLMEQLQAQGDMTSQDLLVVQRETAQMQETTQLTSELMKSLRDMVSSVLKNVA